MRLWPKRTKSEPVKDTDKVPEWHDDSKPESGIAGQRWRDKLQRWAFIQKNAIPKKPEFISDSGVAMDAAISNTATFQFSGTVIPDVLFSWYVSQTFIGWQACAVLSQHWLINKACNMQGKDAVQGGWIIARDDGGKITPEQNDILRTLDKRYKVCDNLVEASFYRNIFGIRLIWFQFEGMDYSKPFNPAMVMPKSYIGMSQMDPYWCAPYLTGESVQNPGSRHFYVPEYWQVAGQRIHRSHFVILYGAPVPDILKPTYIYGGVPLTQRIYERVYAAERTANEAPQLALAKRLTVRYTNLDRAMMDQESFEDAIAFGSKYQDNWGVMVAGEDERVERHETSLSDLDVTIMTQYQLVAAIAEVPATKLLGTSPKGFGAAGDYEIKNYHEKLRDLQDNDLTQILDRHYQALALSELSDTPRPDIKLKPVWLPLDKPSSAELAELNKLKADTDAILQTAGAIDGHDIRQRIIKDEDSGYTGIKIDELPEEPISGEENEGPLDQNPPAVGGVPQPKPQVGIEGDAPPKPGVGGGKIFSSAPEDSPSDDQGRGEADKSPIPERKG